MFSLATLSRMRRVEAGQLAQEPQRLLSCSVNWLFLSKLQYHQEKQKFWVFCISNCFYNTCSVCRIRSKHKPPISFPLKSWGFLQQRSTLVNLGQKMNVLDGCVGGSRKGESWIMKPGKDRNQEQLGSEKQNCIDRPTGTHPCQLILCLLHMEILTGQLNCVHHRQAAWLAVPADWEEVPLPKGKS